MPNKTPDQFSLYAPDDEESERNMPERLEIMDDAPGRKRPKNALPANAYDPYKNEGVMGDTARMRKPRVDLRQLSEWIKTTQAVKTLREEDFPTVPPESPESPEALKKP
jgi:hypothetical protein